jgi:nucleotide-binding universal stress UspA family protein
MKRILVAYDGTDEAKRAIETTIELAKALDGTVSVISVIPRRPGRSPSDPWDDKGVHDSELREAARLLGEHGIEPELLEPVGEPAKEIERIAQTGGYDLLVIGSRGLSGIRRFLSGSVSEHVATHAKETVVIVR